MELLYYNHSQEFSVLQLMILVDDVGGILPAINHSPWNGVTLADFVMPFFLFMVGVSLALTYKVHLQILSRHFRNVILAISEM